MECIGPCTARPRYTHRLAFSLHSNCLRPVLGARCSNRSACSRQRSYDTRCDASRRGVLRDQILSGLVGGVALAAVAVTQCTQPAWAELETVPPATVSSLARAIPQQKVDKGRIWLICLLGAAGLFVGTVLLENNERFFPAISKANKAMASARKSQEARAKVNEAIEVGGNADTRLQNAVSAGLSEARQRVLSEPAGSSAQQEPADSGAEGLGQQHESSLPVTLQERDPAEADKGEQVSQDKERRERELVADSRKQ